jgi:hypothetical protein
VERVLRGERARRRRARIAESRTVGNLKDGFGEVSVCSGYG